jgi:hypothetical protein
VKRGVAGSALTEENGWAAFEKVLDEVERSDDGGRWSGRGGRPLGHPFATFAAPIDSGPEESLAPAERWDRALDWLAEAAELGGAARPAFAMSDNPDAIAAELGLARALTREQLKRARRRFMWENHPDRHPDAPRDLANRRVAIANMLIDCAEEALRKDGAP